MIDEIYIKYPFYGVRRITDELRYEHDLVVNHKKVHRLMREMGIRGITPKKKTSISNDSHKKYPYLLKGYEIKSPNEVWMSDITYIRMEKGYMYLVAILDWYSRYVVSWELSNTMEADFCVESLQAALEVAKPKISNTDQGSQFTSERYINVLEENEIKISMDGRGRCYDNIWVERLWRSVKYEEVYLHEYRSGDEAREQLEKYFTFYNQKRRHQSLDRRPPVEVYFNC